MLAIPFNTSYVASKFATKGYPQRASVSKGEKTMATEKSDVDFLDMQAYVGITKHVGGIEVTDELLSLCHIADAREVVLPRTGHMLRFTHPIAYSNAIEAFIREHVEAGADHQRWRASCKEVAQRE